MTQLTSTQVTQLNNMNMAAQRGSLGTRLSSLEFGDAVEPSAGTLEVAPVLHYNLETPYVGTATKMHAAVLLANGATTTVTTAITNPDFPRILSVKGNDGNVTGNVVITGTDINDDAITETIASNAANEVFGAKAFKTVTSIVLPAYAVAGTESISIGMGDKFGFPVAIPNDDLVIASSFNGSADVGTTTESATVPASIYAVAGTLDGAKDVDLWFISA